MHFKQAYYLHTGNQGWANTSLCLAISNSRGSGRLLTAAIALTRATKFNCKTSHSQQYTKITNKGDCVSDSIQAGVMFIYCPVGIMM